MFRVAHGSVRVGEVNPHLPANPHHGGFLPVPRGTCGFSANTTGTRKPVRYIHSFLIFS